MKKNVQGFTLIELILVIGLVAVIGATASPFLSNFILRNNYETTTDKLVSSLRKAQQYSIQGKQDSVWGACLSANVIRLYRGSCAAPIFAEDFDVPSTITITGFTDTTFSRLRGEPSTALAITLTSAIGTKAVTVNAAGMITGN